MKNKKIYIATFVIILLLLLTPIIFKTDFSDKVFTSQETYHNLILKNQIEQEPIQQQITKHNLFHITIQKINLNDVQTAILIPLITGIISIILILLFLRTLNLSDNETNFVLILFALSPIFLYTFTSLTPDNFAFPLLILVTLLYLKKSYFTIIPLILLALINPILATLVVIATITKLIIQKQKTKKQIILHIILILTTLSIIITQIITNKLIIQINKVIIDGALIELGSLTGYSIPLIILGTIGLFVWWEKVTERTITAIILITGFVTSIIIPQIRLPVALTLAIFAGIGINQLINSEWELKKIKQFALLLIFYVILFSAIITLNTQFTQITKQEVEAAKYLATTNTNGTVISTEDKGFMIKYLSNKETLLNPNSWKENNYEEKINITNQIFYARQQAELEKLLINNNIKYIFLHEDMKTGQVWTQREEGLQFFLIYSDIFIKIFDNEKVQIYKYIKNVEQI